MKLFANLIAIGLAALFLYAMILIGIQVDDALKTTEAKGPKGQAFKEILTVLFPDKIGSSINPLD